MGCGCRKTPEQILAERMQRLAEIEAKRLRRLNLSQPSPPVAIDAVHPLPPDQVRRDG